MTHSKDSNELLSALTLLETPHIGDTLAIQLVHHFGSAEAAVKAPLKQLLTIPGLGDKRAKAIHQASISPTAIKELEFINKNNIELICFNDPRYPINLQQIPDKPFILYKKGNFDNNHPKKVAIVGTRNPSAYGIAVTEKIVQDLQSYNIQIISGLAYGVDILAHRKALQLGMPTIGVLAHGLDRIYPSAHRHTAKQMLDNGGLLTEYPSGTNPDKNNFPMRNRIVAGYADIVIVVESKKKGGALITAKIAASYNRDVAAFPGNITSDCSEGCNYLIKTQIAHLIQDVSDIAAVMNWDTAEKQHTQAKLFNQLSKDEQSVVDLFMLKSCMHIDELLLKSKMDTSALAAILLSLEMQYIIKPIAGKRFQLL